MNTLINKFNQKELSKRDRRLLIEWQGIDSLCQRRKEKASNPKRPSISYIIRRKNVIGLPIEYEIWYRCKTIVGVKNTAMPREPIFGGLHKMAIILPSNYPSADGNPQFTFKTKVWHPNIRYAGSFQGKVCLTIKDMGVLASLETLILRVEQYLKYQLYHAKNTYPYPEDQNVAEWVCEEAEPNGWTHFDQDIPEDNPPTSVASNNAVPKQKEEPEIQIIKI